MQVRVHIGSYNGEIVVACTGETVFVHFADEGAELLVQ